MAEQDTNGLPSKGASRKRRDDKRAKRDPKSWENVFKSVEALSDNEKLKVIQEKYKSFYEEVFTQSSTIKEYERRTSNLEKENKHLQIELKKNILTRSKLETLARELQKQNKEIKEENYTRLKEEEEKRKVVATSFTEKLNTLTSLMDESKTKSLRLREENINMTTKLTELYNQFQEREVHLATMNNQMELQKKLADTQLKKREIEFHTERQMWQKERAILLDNLEKSDETNKVLQENVRTLQEHLNTYQQQYSDFEATMKRSNEVFDTFRGEIAKMHKSIAAMEKERNEWHSRWQSSTQTIVNLTELHQKAVTDQKNAQKKVSMLEKLCRKLNTERSAYIGQLKQHNIIPTTPAEENDEIIHKEKQIVALKNELKVIEDLMNETTEKEQIKKAGSQTATNINTESATEPNTPPSNGTVNAKDATTNLTTAIDDPDSEGNANVPNISGSPNLKSVITSNVSSNLPSITTACLDTEESQQ